MATFLANARALVLAEAGTVAWFAVRFDKATFAIFDAFNDESGRTAHLNGAVAAALMANAADLLAVAPEDSPTCRLGGQTSSVTAALPSVVRS